ncbi:hypothetical protein SESBI_44266 [Sesbania bispinosa]|nr:hypothetical protein SESBI_44266 [Sesbania bispinosa]
MGGVHWRAWHVLSRRKKEGGLGFRDFNIMNLAYLGKQTWRLQQQPNALWAQILRGMYFPSGDFFHAKKGSRPSWAWSSLLEGREFLKTNGRWSIASGKEVDFWTNNWLATGSCLGLFFTGMDAKVGDFLSPGSRAWDLNKLNQHLPSQVIQGVLQTSVQLEGEADTFYWPHERSGRSGSLARRGWGRLPICFKSTSRPCEATDLLQKHVVAGQGDKFGRDWAKVDLGIERRHCAMVGKTADLLA